MLSLIEPQKTLCNAMQSAIIIITIGRGISVLANASMALALSSSDDELVLVHVSLC